jgi:GNAT superfamily N-acetyltransferase
VSGEEGHPPEIRTATLRDRDALRGMLVRAFDRDPLTNWYVRKDARREEGMSRLFDWYLGQALPLGHCHTTPDHSAAALWMGPGKWKLSLSRQIALLGETLHVVGVPRLFSRIPRIQKLQQKHPSDPHYYLAVLGTEPGVQGHGLGSAVLREGVLRCDEAGLPAYLETSSERNVPLYERHGFQVQERITVSGGGPDVWLMWREAR